MRKLAIAAILAGGFVVAATIPASAAVYCFDGYGRSLGGGFDRETPDYRQIHRARRTGGYCRDLGRGHSIPHLDYRQRYYGDGYYYRRYRYDDYYPYWQR